MKNIYIFGLGALGSNILVQLIKKYPDYEFIGIDYDIVEERNINTQVYFLSHINLPKVHAIKAVLASKLKQFKYTAIQLKLQKEEDFSTIWDKKKLDKDDVILDCFDNVKARKLIMTIPHNNILHAGFSPEYTAEVLWDKRYDVPGEVDPTKGDICTMVNAVSFIQNVTALVAYTVSEFCDTGVKNNYIISNNIKVVKI